MELLSRLKGSATNLFTEVVNLYHLVDEKTSEAEQYIQKNSKNTKFLLNFCYLIFSTVFGSFERMV